MKARWTRTLARIALLALLAAVLVVGCSPKQPEADPPAEQPAQATADTDKKAAPKEPPSEPRFRQSFADATRAEPPPDCRPSDTTATGKATGKLYTEVKKLWDTIPLVGDDGKPLAYRATLKTKLGDIEIDLKPELAPNHVRNFIALARAGYYDGLLFDGIVHQKSPNKPEIKVDLLSAGNPTGTDETGFASFGSIGYWLKPEFVEKALHEEGAVGAIHGEEADTAACRFYIMLSKAPNMDGNNTVFGKVSKGLDVARKIATQPFKPDENEEGYGRPLMPVVIEKATVEVVK